MSFLFTRASSIQYKFKCWFCRLAVVDSFFQFAHTSIIHKFVWCKISDKETAREWQKIDGIRLRILIFQKELREYFLSTSYKEEFVYAEK